jgi:hypothetical protein
VRAEGSDPGHGHIGTDAILAREGVKAYRLSGIPAAQRWVQDHAEKGGYDVAFATDPSSAFRPGGGDPKLFRYQIQGPLAGEPLSALALATAPTGAGMTGRLTECSALGIDPEGSTRRDRPGQLPAAHMLT